MTRTQAFVVVTAIALAPAVRAAAQPTPSAAAPAAQDNFQRDIDEKRKIDERYAAITKGVVDFKKVTYRSSVGDLDIPAYRSSR
jgi:hypothetical protein